MKNIKKSDIDETPVPEEVSTTNENDKKKKSKKKIAILSVFLALCVLGGLSFVLLYCIPEKDVNPMFDSEKQEEIIGMYGSTQSYIYYPIDHNIQVMNEREYLDLDRSIYYTKGAETIVINDDDFENYTADVQFFKTYFDLAILGKYDAYNALFTENYYSSNEPYYSFTQQMIYDINIEKLGEGTVRGMDSYSYNLSYKIHKNNGTFRNDIGSDGSKTLNFTLVDQDGIILVDSIDYYK